MRTEQAGTGLDPENETGIGFSHRPDVAGQLSKKSAQGARLRVDLLARFRIDVQWLVS